MRVTGHLSGYLARHWELTVTSEWFRHGYNAVVLPVAQGGRALALKLTWPPGQVQGEAQALAAWRGRGVVELVAADAARGALLLERRDCAEPDCWRPSGTARWRPRRRPHGHHRT